MLDIILQFMPPAKFVLGSHGCTACGIAKTTERLGCDVRLSRNLLVRGGQNLVDRLTGGGDVLSLGSSVAGCGLGDLGTGDAGSYFRVDGCMDRSYPDECCDCGKCAGGQNDESCDVWAVRSHNGKTRFLHGGVAGLRVMIYAIPRPPASVRTSGDGPRVEFALGSVAACTQGKQRDGSTQRVTCASTVAVISRFAAMQELE